MCNPLRDAYLIHLIKSFRIELIGDYEFSLLIILQTWTWKYKKYLILWNMYVWLSALTSQIIRIIMKRKNDGKMQSEKSNLFSASAILRIIFYISTFTVLLMMFLVQNETNLDVVAIRNYVDVMNTSSPLQKISVKYFSVSFNTLKRSNYFAYFS